MTAAANPPPSVLVVVGVPGSGKTTVAALRAAVEGSGANKHPVTVPVEPPPRGIVERVSALLTVTGA